MGVLMMPAVAEGYAKVEHTPTGLSGEEYEKFKQGHNLLVRAALTSKLIAFVVQWLATPWSADRFQRAWASYVFLNLRCDTAGLATSLEEVEAFLERWSERPLVAHLA
jgi:hypothetical protein